MPIGPSTHPTLTEVTPAQPGPAAHLWTCSLADNIKSVKHTRLMSVSSCFMNCVKLPSSVNQQQTTQQN